MKKLYIILLLSFVSNFVSGQNYYPLLDSAVNRWTYTGIYLPVRAAANGLCTYGQLPFTSAIQETVADTMINNIVYKVVDIRDFGSSISCRYGYLREDTASRKVYFVDNVFSPEVLIYDFSLVQGDTLSLNFQTNGGYYANGVYTVDSVVAKPVYAGIRKHFYLSHPSLSSHQLEWVEGVGHRADLVYLYSSNSLSFGFYMQCGGFPYDFTQLLTCFNHAQKIYMDSCAYQTALTNGCLLVVDSCNYWNICTGIEEANGLIHSLMAYPNPATVNATLTINATVKTSASVSVLSLDGKQVLPSVKTTFIPGLNQLDLSLKGLSSGTYLIRCETDNEVRYKMLSINSN